MLGKLFSVQRAELLLFGKALDAHTAEGVTARCVERFNERFQADLAQELLVNVLHVRVNVLPVRLVVLATLLALHRTIHVAAGTVFVHWSWWVNNNSPH